MTPFLSRPAGQFGGTALGGRRMRSWAVLIVLLLTCGAGSAWSAGATIFRPAPAADERGAMAAAVRTGVSGTPVAPAMPGPAPSLREWLWRGGLAVLGLPLFYWMVARRQNEAQVPSPGFEVITDSEPRRFIPLTDKYHQLDFITSLKTQGDLRLSANLNKVSLSIRRFGYLMEDRNFRNALLVNRRRVRRTVLNDGDVLDLGDLTLLYRDNRVPPVVRHSSVTPPEGKVNIKVDRMRGPVRRGTGMLVWRGQPPRTFYFTKNVMFVGRSETNDLVIKAQNVGYRHARIDKVGGRYKLVNLTNSGNTYVNNRRIESRFLKDGDEVTFDTHKFTFSLVTKPVRERRSGGTRAVERPVNEPDDSDQEDVQETAEQSAGA